MSDVSIQERVFAECVGALIQKQIWLFEVSREFASEEWSEPVQFRFELEPGAYPQLIVRQAAQQGEDADAAEGKAT